MPHSTGRPLAFPVRMLYVAAAAFAFTVAASLQPADAATIALRGVATGMHPYALVEIDGSVFILSTGDEIAGRKIRKIDVNGVRLSDGTVLHVTSARSTHETADARPYAVQRPPDPVPPINVNVTVLPPPDTFDSYGTGAPAYLSTYGAPIWYGYNTWPYDRESSRHQHRRRFVQQGAWNASASTGFGAPAVVRTAPGLAPIGLPLTGVTLPISGAGSHGMHGF